MLSSTRDVRAKHRIEFPILKKNRLRRVDHFSGHDVSPVTLSLVFAVALPFCDKLTVASTSREESFGCQGAIKFAIELLEVLVIQFVHWQPFASIH